MQTFLPNPDFNETASILDSKRLGNQCYRECLTLYNGKWEYHPACKMWAPHPWWLCSYALALANEMALRSYWKPGIPTKWINFWKKELSYHSYSTCPWWLGKEELHSSHRSNLLRKDPVYYGQFNWKEEDNLPYFWPVK